MHCHFFKSEIEGVNFDTDYTNDVSFDHDNNDVIKVTMSFDEKKFENKIGNEGIRWLLNRLGDVKSYNMLYLGGRYEVVAIYDQFRLPKKEKAMAFAQNCGRRHLNDMKRDKQKWEKSKRWLQAILDSDP